MILIPPVLLGQAPITIDRLDALAQSRDVTGLGAFLAPHRGASPFNILKTGGGYAAGSMGWHAKMLEPKDGTAKYVVFSTPILVEDAGELLFRVNSNNKLEFIPERDSFGMRLDSHSFDVSFDLPAHKVFVVDQFRGTWTAPPKAHMLFRLAPSFTVSSVDDAAGNPVPFTQSGGVVAISSNGGNREWKVKYEGTVDKPGFSKVIGPAEATLSGTMWYPMVARHPTTYDITMHCPASWLALAQGDEISSTVDGADRVTKYRMNLPVVWISATAGPYRRVTTQLNGINFSTISATATDAAMKAQNENNAEVVDFYSKTFGKYPFKSWTTVDSVQFQQGVGALEAYSFATYPAGGVPFHDSHEPAHTWWGGMINNDYLASIRNESFADYSQEIFKRDRPIGNLVERQRAFVTETIFTPEFDAAPLNRSGQDIGPPATILGYVKGAYVLRALEDELGTPTFLHALHEWIHSNPVAHVGSWEDFESVVDRVAGRDCKWFFDEWVRLPGLPDFSLTKAQWSAGKLTGRVEFKGAPYRIDSDVALKFPDGSRSYWRVFIDPKRQGQFVVDCPKRPAVVSLDPWQIIARRNVRPPGIQTISQFSRTKAYLDPKTPAYLKAFLSSKPMDRIPTDLNGLFLVGSPASLPALKPLCKKAGFSVVGDKLTYKGTTIDLNSGGAVAIVNLPSGKHCMIGLGAYQKVPDTGKARLAVFDGKGHVLRADTDPVETGPLSIRL